MARKLVKQGSMGYQSVSLLRIDSKHSYCPRSFKNLIERGEIWFLERNVRHEEDNSRNEVIREWRFIARHLLDRDKRGRGIKAAKGQRAP